MTHPSGPAGGGPAGGAGTGPGRAGDRRLLRLFYALPIALTAALAVVVAFVT